MYKYIPQYISFHKLTAVSPNLAAESRGVAAPFILAYSINNILGMTQGQQRHHQDANENILKRKRDDDGQY